MINKRCRNSLLVLYVPTTTVTLCEINNRNIIFCVRQQQTTAVTFLNRQQQKIRTSTTNAKTMDNRSNHHQTTVDDCKNRKLPNSSKNKNRKLPNSYYKNRKLPNSSKEKCGDDGRKNNPIDDTIGQVETTSMTDDSIENHTAAPLPNPSNNKSMVMAAYNRLSTIWKIVFMSAILAVIGGAITFLGLSVAKSSMFASSSSSSSSRDDEGQTFHSIHPSPPPSEIPSTTPSFAPSELPSSVPSTGTPSVAPSTIPSLPPSEDPSVIPSTSPSTSASSTPTVAPTQSYIPVNPVPDNPPRGYFNYDPEDNDYGPRRWSRVSTSQHPLQEFTWATGWGPFQGHLEDKEPLLNRCGDRDRRQSPKDLTSTGGVPCALLNDRLCDCDAHHEIRTKCGYQGLSSEDFTSQIMPHKLSLKMNRRQCLDLENEECDNGRPPIADYPRYSSTMTPFSDLLNFDIKVPGEHTIEGEEFDAEIQMLHTHLDKYPARVSSIGVMIRATSDGYNTEFQQVLNLFQIEYNTHANACRTKQRRNLLRTTTTHTTPKRNENQYDYLNSTTTVPQQQRMERDLLVTNQYRRFNPYSEALMPGIHFYRYDGSITEPPCMDITWWVMMEPMVISFAQLQQTKDILFSHVDEDCIPTSVHNSDQSVSRPLFPLGTEREIQKCGPEWFASDIDKGHSLGRKC